MDFITTKVAFEYKDDDYDLPYWERLKNQRHNEDLDVLYRALLECGFSYRDWGYTNRDGKYICGFTIVDYNADEFERQFYHVDKYDALGLLHDVLSIDDLIEMVCKRGRFIHKTDYWKKFLYQIRMEN